jgi:hypothetical protein
MNFEKSSLSGHELPTAEQIINWLCRLKHELSGSVITRFVETLNRISRRVRVVPRLFRPGFFQQFGNG